jgi:hypothetical protein
MSGKRAPSTSRRLVLTALCAAAFIAIPASQASAEIVIDLAGAGTGTVTSNPADIDCSNTPGVEREGAAECSGTFLELAVPNVSLTATPDAGSVFAGWMGNGLDGTCNSGSANPCALTDPAAFGFPPSEALVTITANFVPAPDVPIVSTGSATGIGDAAATLHGSVDPNGATVGDCYFEYGTSSAYGAVAACSPSAGELGAGEEAIAVSALIEGLEAGTEYHYRLVAENIGGEAPGSDQSFSTTGEAACGNVDRQIEQGIESVLLPVCMALEMVSPPQKAGQPAEEPAVAAGGDRVKFHTLATPGEPGGLLGADGEDYVATRGDHGWISAPTAAPGGQFVQGWTPTGEAWSYAPDFSSWFKILSTQAELNTGASRAYRGSLSGFFAPLSPLLEPRVVTDPFSVVARSTFHGASADHSHLYFRPGGGINDVSTAYLPGDPEPNPGTGSSRAEQNTYVAHLDKVGKPSLELLVRDRFGKLWGGNCGAHLGGAEGVKFTTDAINGNRTQGAVSTDGTKVFFSARAAQPAGGSCSTINKLRILERLETDQGIYIAPLFGSECSREAPACDLTDGDDRFQGASVDGKRVYFTTNRQLTDSDLDSGSGCSRTTGAVGCDLYLYDAELPPGQRLVQVSAGEDVAGKHDAGIEAKVYNGVAAISGDGSHVYFAAQGVLTNNASPEGRLASEFSATTPKFYLYQRDATYPDGRIVFIGPLHAGDGGNGSGSSGLWGSSSGTFTNRAYPVPALGKDSDGREVGGDGHVLAFQSNSALTADDTDGAQRDIFRYDAASHELDRISKAAVGGEDNGPHISTVLVWSNTIGTDFAEMGRWVSEDGKTIVFKAGDGLMPGDLNGVTDSYVWRNGRPFRLPGTPETGEFTGEPVLSHDGDTVAFQSFDQLLPEDGDINLDVYVARVGGGFKSFVPEPPCQPDESLPGPHCPKPEPQAPGDPPIAAPSTDLGNFPPGRICSTAARRAQRLSVRAKRLRRVAQRTGNPRQARRMRRAAGRSARKARQLSRSAKRCRRAVRRASR